jgi:hypothetical protein
MIERGKIDTHKTHIHDRSLSGLGTGTSIKGGGIKLVLWTLTLYDLSYLKVMCFWKFRLWRVVYKYFPSVNCIGAPGIVRSGTDHSSGASEFLVRFVLLDL